MDSPGTPEVTERGTGSIHNLQVDDYCGWVYALSITGDLTLNEIFKEQTDDTLTVGDDLIINNGGWLWWPVSTANTDIADDFTINSGGKVTATSGTIYCGGVLTNNEGVSAWIHSEGTLNLDASSGTMSHRFNEAVFWNVVMDGGARHRFATSNDEVWIENNLDVTMTYFEVYSTEFRLGSLTQSGSITGDTYIYPNGAASQRVEIWGVSEDYPATISLSDAGGNAMVNHYFTSLKWVTFTKDIETPNSGKYLYLDGDCTVEDMYIQSGDFFDQQGHHLTVTGWLRTSGTYATGSDAGLTIGSGGNYTLSKDSGYRKVYVNGDLLTADYDFTVSYRMILNSTGNFWAESSTMSIGASVETNIWSLYVHGDYYGGDGDHTIGSFSVGATGVGNMWATSGTTTITSHNTAWFYSVSYYTNTFYHQNGLFVFDRVDASTQHQGIASSSLDRTIAFWDVVIESKKAGPMLSTDWHSQVTVENNLVIQSGASWIELVSGSPSPSESYLHVVGDVIVNGTLDQDLVNSDHEFGSLTVTGSAILSSGVTEFTAVNGNTNCIEVLSGSSFDPNGGVAHFTYNSGSGYLKFETTDWLHDVTVTGQYIRWRQDTTISGDLVVNSGGKFYQQTSTQSLTVSGDTTVSGTLGLAGWSGICTLTGGLVIESGGEFIGSSGTNNLGKDLYVADYPNYWKDGSTFTGGSGLYYLGATRVGSATLDMSSGNMHFMSKHSSSYSFFYVDDAACTMNHNNGKVYFDNTYDTFIFSTTAAFEYQFYNLQLTSSSARSMRWKYGSSGTVKMHVYNDFTIDSTVTLKIYSTPTAGLTSFIVDGTTTINGFFNLQNDVNDHSFGKIIIGAAGRLLSTRGRLNVYGWDVAQEGIVWTNNGDFDHNSGTVVAYNYEQYTYRYEGSMTGDNAFYNFLVKSHTDGVGKTSVTTMMRGDVQVINQLWGENGNTDFLMYNAGVTLTLGSGSQSCTVYYIELGMQSYNDCTVKGFSPSYPAYIMGNVSEHFIDGTFTNRQCSQGYIGDLVFVGNINTGVIDSGVITLVGDVSFEDLTIDNPSTLDLAGYRIDVFGIMVIGTGSSLDLSGGSIIGYDTLSIADDWGSSGDEADGTIQTQNGITFSSTLTIPSGSTLYLNDNPTVTVPGTFTITSGGVFEAPSGEIDFGGFASNSGSFYHNDGEVIWSGSKSDISGSWTFYDVRINGGGNYIDVLGPWTVEHIFYGDVNVRLTGITLTVGTNSASGQFINGGTNTIISPRSGSPMFTAASADYPVIITGNDGNLVGNGAVMALRWLDFRVNVNTGYNSITYSLQGDCSFQGLVIGSPTILALNGYRATINGTFTSTSSLTTGATSSITITGNGSWTANQNVTLQELEIDGSIEIISSAGCKNITFTGPGFKNSTGTINVTGSYGDLVYITGTQYWEINANAIDYFWKYVNVSHGYNTGSSALVALGEGFDLLGPWDFQAPLITPHFITEGKFIDTRYTSILRLDWTAEDMSYLYALNITISDYLGSIIFTQEINESTFGVTAAYRWNLSVTIENLSYGRLLINYTASDAHNSPASPKAKKNADSMLCDLDGELVGHPSGKDKSDKLETNTIKFKKAGPFVSDLFDIDFLTDKKGSQHVVKWTGDNFKMSHWVKLDHGTSVPMRITADSIEHIPASEFGAAHFLINGDYFYDASDFEATGGKILLLDQGTLDGKEFVTISFTHPDWKKGGGWGLIDPLTGAINSRSEFYNISVGTIPEVVIPKDNAKLPGDSTSTTLKVRVYGAGSFEGTVHFYNESGVLLGSQNNVTNNTVALVELESLGTDTLYPWYTVLSVGGENFTSPLWSFRTGGLEGKSAAPGSGRERYGDSVDDPMDPITIVFFIIFITLIVLLTKLWIGEEVKKP